MLENESLKKIIPSIIKFYWDFDLNKELPENISIFSENKYFWKNIHGTKFHLSPLELEKPLSSTSNFEQIIFFYIKKLFQNAVSRYKYQSLKLEADVFIPELNLAIEYDGSYYHKNKVKKDEKKNLQLNNYGVFVIRIRDTGLPQLAAFDGEVIAYNGDSCDTINTLIKIVLKHIQKEKVKISKHIIDKLKKFNLTHEKLYLDSPYIYQNYHLLPADNTYHQEIMINFYNAYTKQIFNNNEIFKKFKKLSIVTRGFFLFDYIKDEDLAKKYYDEEMDGWTFNKVIDISVIDDMQYLKTKLTDFIYSDYYFWWENIIEEYIKYLDIYKDFNQTSLKKIQLLLKISNIFLKIYPDFYRNWYLKELIESLKKYEEQIKLSI